MEELGTKQLYKLATENRKLKRLLGETELKKKLRRRSWLRENGNGHAETPGR